MPEVVGLLPMGGNGTRLGMPFPKPLAPTITEDGVVPVYRHVLAELHVVTGNVWAIINSDTDRCLSRALETDGVRSVLINQPSLPAALGEAGQRLARIYGSDVLIACALPDSIWSKRTKTMADVVGAVRGDRALALFTSSADQLDDVLLDGDRVRGVITKKPGSTGKVLGWGAFVVRAGALAEFTGLERDGPQLGRLDMGWVHIGDYVDLGTPDRYIRWHDTRWWINAGSR